MHDAFDALMECGNGAIVDMAMKCESVFNSHDAALVSISGGADSDAMLDLCERVRNVAPIRITYAFLDTGIELAATKRQLDRLENRYGIEIVRERPEKTIPVAVREEGQPFLSKYVSYVMGRLQAKGFQWEDEPLDSLTERYPDAKGYLKWWADEERGTYAMPSMFRVSRNKWLKEFVIDNPPWFQISDRCCYHAKKHPAHKVARRCKADLVVQGMRKSEGGVRATVTTCFSKARSGEIDVYRPLFWLKDADRAFYDERFGIYHSDCYEVYGFKRTGCTGCPFNPHFETDNEVVAQYEPRMARAARKVFADSYEYTRMYRDYARRRDDEAAGRLTAERVVEMGFKVREI